MIQKTIGSNRYVARLALKLLLLFFSTPANAQTVGMIENRPGNLPGYFLFAPLHSQNTYLIDRCGRMVHQWKSKYKPGQSAYLLPDGNLLRCGKDTNTAFISGGGIIEKLNWNSEVIWSYAISTPTSCLHHDIYPMPNGNVLAILWEKKTPAQAKVVGRNPEAIGKSIWTEKIVELKPKGKNGAIVVWEWRVWDHLVQDVDPKLAGFGVVADNPQRIHINFKASKDEDWLHFNAVAYNAELDQVLVSNRNFSEIFILDHSTTTKQAATRTGGRYKRGGDLLYRWGNPAAYNCGTAADRRLYSQHSAHWIAKGLNDAGKLMVFNNGIERSQNPYSSIDIVEPPMDKAGNYQLQPREAALPAKPYWSFSDTLPEIFFSKNVSNAQRLPDGHTLICGGASGLFFEIDSAGNRVWKYVNPVAQSGIAEQGAPVLDNQVFRCLFYEENYAAFKGKQLVPQQPVERNPLQQDCITGPR